MMLLTYVTAVLAAIAIGACGASGDDEDVRQSVELFFARNEPRGCDVQTERFQRNIEDEAESRDAMRRCRDTEAGRGDESPFAPIESATASDIEVDGDRATAKAEVRGSDFDGQVLTVALVKDGETWKIDGLDGVEVHESFRKKFDREAAGVVEQSLRETVAPAKVEPVVGCVLERFRRDIPNERIAERFEGRLEPGRIGGAARKAAQNCLFQAGPRTVTGRGYAIEVPAGWVTTTVGGPYDRIVARRDGLGRGGPAVTVVLERGLPAGMTLRQYYDAARAQTGELEFPRSPSRTSLGGVNAISFESALDREDGRHRLRKVIALRHDTAYIVTFDAPSHRFAADMNMLEAITASWHWR
jgi:hypothetical protein